MTRSLCSHLPSSIWMVVVLSINACSKTPPASTATHAPVADLTDAPPAVDAKANMLPSEGRPFARAVSTPNQFFAQGTPTFVVGTGGDDRADGEILAQATLIRDSIFPQAKIVTDTSIDVSKGPASWPPNAVLYGGPAYNALLAHDTQLPFTLTPGDLSIGSQHWHSPHVQIITVVPAQGPHPTFLLYASTGSPGIAEINSLHHGRHPILIGDEFGEHSTGVWMTSEAGVPFAQMSMPAQRPTWRTVTRALTHTQGKVYVNFLGPTAESNEPALADACVAGTERSAEKLHKPAIGDITFYVYPNRATKGSLTSDPGDGHAVVAARVLHVIQNPPAAMENLIAHEATHVIANSLAGPAGSSCMGEGLAVWVSGQYGGTPLANWPGRIPAPPAVSVLMTNAFRRMPEGQAYPWCGTLAGLVIDKVGVDNFLENVLPATASTWIASVIQAGGRPNDLDLAFQRSWPASP